ncbi:MAG: TMEM14 family protein [Akkermansiaceae bacterium]
MTNSKWLIGYGAFLFLCGLAGYLSNPAAAKTALISGSVFGGLSVIWGLLLGKGFGFAKWAALVTTLMLCAVFSWRSFASWQKVMDGEPKTFAATLITLMLIGSLATVGKILLKK